MNERDFDNIFRDNIGDELPFDFRPDDWQSAAQELDKVLPIVPPAPVVVPQPRILTWHKWAAAAAVVFVMSQTWLLAKLFDMNQEISTLKGNNTAAIQTNEPNAAESHTVIKYDTIVRTIVMESNEQKAAFNNTVADANTSDKNAAYNEIYKQVYKDVYKQVRKEIGTELEATKAALAAASKATPQSEQVKSTLPNATQSTSNAASNNVAANSTSTKAQNIAKNDAPNSNNESKTNNITPNIVKNEAIASQKNELPSDKNNTPIVDKSAENKADIAAVNRNKEAFTAIPSLTMHPIKSNNKEQMWMNEENTDALYWAAHRRNIIKPLSIPSNWTIGLNALGMWTEYPMDSLVMNKGINLRLAYDLRNNWRLTADVETWKESFDIKIDTSHHHNPPIPNFNFEKANYSSTLLQLRLGADYQYFNKTIFTPYVGAGITYKQCVQKNIELQLKNIQKPNDPSIRVNDRNFDKEFQSSSPLYASLRAGVNTKLLKRLSLNTNITGQWRMNGKSNQVWSAQVGLAYNL